ncbi:response regulator transcription factor [Nonomuraea polychroma]|uniref:helix-turn-helix transcriptional regulator n=1 Tax=Nonomuraea polychroma TaxID=46176 RepID=UPI003D8C2889
MSLPTRDTAPRTVPVSRRLAVVGLVGGALLNGAESIGMRLLLPAQPATGAAKLQAIADTGVTYAVLVTLGTLAIPFMIIGFLALTHLLAQRAPRTGRVAVTLLLTGMFGFFGMHVLSLAQVPLSQSADLVQAGALLDGMEAHPLLGMMFLALAAVVAGEAVYGAHVARRLKAFFTAGAGMVAKPFPELSDGEREVLRLVAAGLGNQAIAQRLHLSEKTVRNRVSTIFTKLDVANRAEAIVKARQGGLN